MFRHLSDEGNGVSTADLRNRDGKRKFHMHPLFRAVQSQRVAHLYRIVAPDGLSSTAVRFRSRLGLGRSCYLDNRDNSYYQGVFNCYQYQVDN